MNNLQFTALYKTWSNQELFQLLQKKTEYQPAAVEAATAELSSRQLSNDEMLELEKEYQDQELQKQATLQKQVENKLGLYKEKIKTELDPFAIQTIDRKVRLFCYSIGIIILFNFLSGFKWITDVFKYGYWDGATVLALAPYFFVPIGIYYFWHKQKFGWSIITSWLIFSLSAIIFNYATELQMTNEGIFARFYIKRGLIYHIIIFLFFGGILFYVNSKKIVSAFSISKKFQQRTIIITALLTLFYFFSNIF